jgi:hypothetical protein
VPGNVFVRFLPSAGMSVFAPDDRIRVLPGAVVASRLSAT